MKSAILLVACILAAAYALPTENNKVQVKFYYEAYCPYCHQAMENSILPSYKQLSSIMDLELVPFGNGWERKVGSQYQFTCQHGAKECTGNTEQLCAFKYIPSTMDQVNLMMCINKYDPLQGFEYCIKQIGKSSLFSQIKTCYTGLEGQELTHAAVLKTKKTGHRYVPWVTINGFHSGNLDNTKLSYFISAICGAYKGTKPAACN